MTNKNGKRYSKELKAKVLKRMMASTNESVKNLSEEMRISAVTLYKWRNEARASGITTPGSGKTSNRWNSEDNFLVVMETYSMNETELADYCREKGLYREKITAWQKVCLQANGKIRMIPRS